MNLTRSFVLGAVSAVALSACPTFNAIPADYCTTWEECPKASQGSYAFCWENKCQTGRCDNDCVWSPVGTPIYLCDISAANCGFECACNTGTCSKTTSVKVLNKEYPIAEGIFPSGYCSTGTSHVVRDAGLPDASGGAPDTGTGAVADGGTAAPDSGSPADAGKVDAGCIQTCPGTPTSGSVCGPDCMGGSCGCGLAVTNLRCATAADSAKAGTCCVESGRTCAVTCNPNDCCSGTVSSGQCD